MTTLWRNQKIFRPKKSALSGSKMVGCRMLSAHFLEPGMVVMSTILAINQESARVFLSEYNIEAVMIEATDMMVVGRIETLIVRSVLANEGMYALTVSRVGVRAEDKYDAEEAFSKATYVHSILK